MPSEINHTQMDRGKPAFAFPSRDVGSYGKLGVQIVMCGGYNLPPLVNIELTDLPKPGWTFAHPAHQSPTSLPCYLVTMFSVEERFIKVAIA